MKTLPRYLVLTLGLVVSVALTGCGGAGGGGGGGGGTEEDFRTSLQLGTGSVGGVYFPLGQEYANLFEENIDVEGLSVNAIETDASVDNLARISRGELQLGLSQNNTAIDAVEGTGDFEGAQVENAGLVGQLYPEAAQIITLERTGIESVEDLRGKRIAVGPPGGGTRAAAEAILAAHGIEEGDYQPHAEGFSDAKAKLQDGNIDASIEVLGVPGASLQELEAATGQAKLIPIEAGQVESIASGTGYEPYEIPADAYDFLEEPISTVSVFACLFASTTQVSEDLGYEITRVVYENADDLTLEQRKFIEAGDALLGAGDLPLHPGAEKYLKEQGVVE